MSRLGLVYFVAILFAKVSVAQSSGTISGAVMDQSGAVLPGVSVNAANVDTSVTRSAVSNERGEFVLTLVPVGTYEMKAALPGFRTEVRRGLVLQVDQRLSVSFNLMIGDLTQSILVLDAAPLVDSETSAVGNVIENRRVVELPLNGREFQSLTLLVPGAVPPTPGSGETIYGAVQIAGTRQQSTAYTLDGMDIKDALVSRPSFKPSVDMIQEFRVQTSTYSAELGRSSGGHIQMTTKSGTNAFHGTLYEFVRNHIFDAKNFFDPAGEPIPAFKRNNFGGSIGGPIKRNQTFIFASYEALRLRQAITKTATVPTLAMVSGDFSALTTPILDPLTKQPFLNNTIPAGRINPVGQRIAQLYPAPNLPGTGRNFVSSPINKRRVDQFSTRIDHRLSGKNSVYGRYSITDDYELDPFDLYAGITNLPGYGRVEEQRTHNIALVDTHVFSPTLAGEFRIGYNRYYELRRQQDTSDVPGNLGIPGTTKNPTETGPPAIRVTGFDSLGKAQLPSYRQSSTYQFNGALTKVHGSHTLKFGGEFVRLGGPQHNQGGKLGDFSFTGQYTGNALADVLVGYPRRVSISRGDTLNHQYRNTYAGYLQDDWKITPRMTLNLGIRYDLFTPIVSASDRQSNFNPETGAIEIAGTANLRRDISRPDLDLGGSDYSPDFAALAKTVTMVDIGKRNVYTLDHNDFSPRVGIAMRMLDNDKLVLRTGYGLYYSQLYLNTGALGVGRNYPFKVTQVFNANATTPNISIDNPFPVGLGAATVSPASVKKEFRTGYVHQYNLGFQYQPLRDLVFELGYVGSLSTKLERSVNINQAVLGTGSIASRRPFPTFGNISYNEPASNANFNSLQLRAERRYAQGLTLLGSYTWSKSIDDHSGWTGAGDNNQAQNNHDWVKTMRGLSNFDLRHRLALSYIYELPMGAGRFLFGDASGFGNWLASGWELSGITTVQSGSPFTVKLSVDASNTGNTGNDRPNLVGDPYLPASERSVDRWFNTTAFEIPKTGTFGNVGRNTMTGPGMHNWDVSLSKRMPVSEGKTLQFRAEVFNIANHPQFALPDADASSAQFGKMFATSVFSRQIQLGLKLIY